jgi:cytochrome P450
MASAPDLHLVPDSHGAAPMITEAVGDVSRPRYASKYWPWPSLDHLPGESGLIAGIQSLVGRVRRGSAFMREQSERFGPVHRSQFGIVPNVCVSDPELLLQILRNEDGAFSTAIPWSYTFRGMDPTSDTLDMPFGLDFDLHREARRLLQPAFGPVPLASYLDMALPGFERAIEAWIARGRVVFKPEIRRLLATTSARIFVGIDDEREGEMLDEALADIWRAPLAIFKDRRFSFAMRRASRGFARLRETLRQRVPERRARGGADLFSRLCAESRGAGWLDDDGLVRLFIGVMVGAFDTTAAATTSMAYLLAKHPEWQERLREEALGVGKARVSYADTKRLEAADRVWKETLRLFPVAGDVPRCTLREVRLGEWTIPAGVAVSPFIATALQDGSWWTDPQRFDPDRFSEARAEDKKHKGLFLPFGAGAHACIGLQLATAEAKGFWHAMLTRCRFRLERDYEGRHGFGPFGIVSGDVALVVERL